MIAIQAYRPLGAVAAVILALGLSLVVKTWPQGGMSKTFSQRVATSKKAIIYYILLFSIVLPLLLLFFIGWFVPTFNLPPLATYFVGLAAVTQFLCTLIPETGGVKSQTHQVLAAVSAISLLPITALIISASQVVMSLKVIATICFLSMLGAGVFGLTTAITTKKLGHSYLLVFQSVYYLAFFVSVLSVAYL